MRALFITTCYPSKEYSQYCIFLEQQAQALKRSGVKTDVLLLCEGKSFDTQRETYNGVDIIKIGIAENTKYDLLFPTELSKCDRDKIMSVLDVDYDNVSFHFGGLKILRSVIKICKLKKVKLFIHFHGLNVWQEYSEKYKLLYDYYRIQKKSLYSKADAAVCVSKKVAGKFTERIKTVPTFTVYNGVNTEFFKCEERSFSDLKKLKVLTVGNLIAIKGHNYLINAVSMAIQKGMEIELTIAGKGPLDNELKTLVKNLGISRNVIFTGSVPYGKIAGLMKANDIFIMPSYYEALGCVYLEAMAAGMITVGVSGQGIDEIITDGINGFLVKPKDVESIFNTLIKISSLNKDQLKKISENAVMTARKYSWNESAINLKSVYQKLTAAK